MPFAITITETTGAKKTIVHDYPDELEIVEFLYTEGNRSCNCTLAELFDGDENNPCTGGREFKAEVKLST